MKLKLTLLLFCLFGVGIFAHTQENNKAQSTKSKAENGTDAIPVVVSSSKKSIGKENGHGKTKIRHGTSYPKKSVPSKANQSECIAA